MKILFFSPYLLLLSLLILRYAFYFASGKGIKSFEEYVVINRSIGSVPLTIILIGMLFIGPYVLRFDINNVLVRGVSGSITHIIAFTIVVPIVASYMFPRLLRFPNTYSLGGLVKHMYGQLAATITTLMVTIAICHAIYYQLTKLIDVSPFFTTNYRFLLLFVGIATILQALWISNNRMSTISMIQLILLTGLFFSLTTIVFSLQEVRGAGGGIQGLLQAIKEHANNHHKMLFTYRPKWGAILNAFHLPVTFIYPHFIQRVLINKSTREMKNAMKGVTFFNILLRLFVIIIGLGGVLLSIKRYGKIIPRFDQPFAPLFSSGWVSFFYIYFILISSTGFISYLLHSLAIEFSQNVIKPLYQHHPIKWDNRVIQLVIVTAGILCIFLSMLGKDYYINFSMFFIIFMIGLFPLILMGCIGLKGNNTIFIISMITFYLTVFIIMYAIRHGHFPIKSGLPFYRQLVRATPIAALTSSMAILVTHLLIYGDWKFISEKKSLFFRRNRGDSFGTMLRNPLSWAKSKIEKYGTQPATIGTFLLVIFGMPSLTGNLEALAYRSTTFFVIRITGITLSVIMMLHNLVPYYLKQIFPLLSLIILGYCMPFAHTFFFLYNPHSLMLFIKLALLLILFRILTDWRTFTLLTLVGSLAALGIYSNLVAPLNFAFSFQEIWHIAEIAILVIIINIVFINHQEQVSQEKILKNQTLTSGFGHDLNNLFQYTSWLVDHEYNDESLVRMLKERSGEFKEGSTLCQTLLNSAIGASQYLLECQRAARVFYEMVQNNTIHQKDIVPINIEKIMEEARSFVPSVFKNDLTIVVKQPTQVLAHPNVLKSCLLNLIKNGFKHGRAKKIILGWDSIKQHLYVKDNGIGIPPEREPNIFDLYYTTGGSGIGLPFIKEMLEKMNASITFLTSPQGTTFFIKLPVVHS